MNLGICGAGTMGRGIALAAIQSGHRCWLYDIEKSYIDKAQEYIKQQLEAMVQKGRLTADQSTACLERMLCCIDLAELSACELVVEAIIEQAEPKHRLFEQLEHILPPTSILASNTSSISIASLARHRQRPDQFIGLHFFNPAHVMKLVEIIRAPQTSDDVTSIATAFIKSLSKTPAIARDVPGFIVNRVARNYYNEAQRIVTESAASIEQVDAIMKSAGFRMGPFELMDLIGVDVNLDVTKSMYQQYFNEPRFQPSVMQQQYVDAGLHGRKTGRGFYDYSKKSS